MAVPERLGNYRLLTPLAKGGMADLYLAKRIDSNGPEVVVKCIQTAPVADSQHHRARMFVDEARIATLLDHPNVVRVYEADYDAGFYFMVMEWLRGWDLRTIKRRLTATSELLPLPMILRLGIDACAGLNAAHECRTPQGEPLRLVHRDVSPSNLFVTEAGVLKLLDFGVAKTRIQAAQTRVGTLKGKLAYMSPEQARSEPLDSRSDIFSLGIVLHELVTGVPLFRRTQQSETLEAVKAGFIPPPLRAGGEQLARVIIGTLQRERELRPRSAGVVEDELRGVGAEIGIATAAEVSEYCRRLLAASALEAATPAGYIAADTLAEWAASVREVFVPSSTTAAGQATTHLDIPGRDLQPNGFFQNNVADSIGATSPPSEFPSPKRRSYFGPDTNDAALEETILVRQREPPPGAGPGDGVLNSEPLREPGTVTVAAWARGRRPLLTERPGRAFFALAAMAAVGAVAVLGVWLVDHLVLGPSVPTRLAPADIDTASPPPPPWVARPDADNRTTIRSPANGSNDRNRPSRGRGQTRPRPLRPKRKGIAPDPRPAQAAPNPALGKLTLDTKPWTKVYLGQRLLGETPLVGVELPAGKLTLELVNREFGIKRTIVVEIPAGGVLRKRLIDL